jgi:AcrR family transcriptional regulator
VNGHSSSSSSSTARSGRLRERLREATAEAILAAAEEVFSEDGFAAARMEQIAARAGVAVGTLYNHFEDRDALVAALLDSRRSALLDRIDAALSRATGAALPERLSTFAEALFEHAEQHGRLLAVLAEAGQGPARSKSGAVRELHARATALLQEGVESGALRTNGAELLAVAFVGVLRGVLVHDLTLSDRAAPAVRAAAVVELFLRGAAR